MRKLTRLARRAAVAFALVLAGVIAFDVAAYFLFPGTVQRIEPEYANDIGYENWLTGRTTPAYTGSETRGFDIAPGMRTVSFHPPHIGPYETWGNSVGCFDAEPPERKTPAIYLAGDSFTWGYAPYEAKFGTILERETGLLVYACGVTNTGTRHQFDKFREIAESFPGWPALVIVNVFTNDIANDHAYPHSVVVDGVWIEDTYLHEEPDLTGIRRIDPEAERAGSSRLKYYLKTYSATLNILNAARVYVRNGFVLQPESPLNMYDLEEFPIRSDIAAEHREIVREWIGHAREHGYALRFALIPHGPGIGTDIYGEYRRFVAEADGTTWDFESFVLANDLSPDELYWAGDFHFNARGNAAYARFLIERLRAEAQAGTLPARLAASR